MLVKGAHGSYNKIMVILDEEACVDHTVYPKKYAHGFVVLCFVVVMQSFIMNSHEVFIHFHQDCFAGTGAIVRLPQCQWNKPDGYGKISQCITTTKHSKEKTVCIFLGIYCRSYLHWLHIREIILCQLISFLGSYLRSFLVLGYIYRSQTTHYFADIDLSINSVKRSFGIWCCNW